jgi:predicted nucleic acid-binding protein
MELIERTAALDLEWVGAERFNRARTMFRQYDDQTFSFTDCTSFVVMRELELTDALTSDDHFRKAGFELVPAP